jgi:hypothetical protein
MGFELQKHILKKSSVDIVNSEDFKACNEVFKAMLIKLKREGIFEVKHKQPISQDLNKMYESRNLISKYCSGTFEQNVF